MTFNLQTFSAEVNKRGILRNNKFEMMVPPPAAFRNYNVTNLPFFTSINNRLQFYGESADIPGAMLEMHEVRRFGYGAVEKKPFNVRFSDIQLMFRDNGEAEVFDFLHAWQSIAVNYTERGNPGGGNSTWNEATGSVINQHPYEVAYRGDYAVDVNLWLFNDKGERKIHVILREAFPIFVGEIQMAWGARGSYVQIPVTLTFNDWYSLGHAAVAAENLRSVAAT